MRLLLRVAYGAYAWLLLVMTVLVATILLLLIPGLRRRRQVARQSARVLFRLAGIEIEVSGATLNPIAPAVVVSNHASYLDGIILTAVLPPSFSFMVKREMRKFPVAGLLLRRLGTEFVNRVDSHRGATDARRIIRAAGAGQGLAVFPEGTFRREPGLGQFYSGAFAAAVRSTIPVIPITIRGSRQILPAGKHLPIPGKLDIIVHPSILPANPDSPRTEAPRIRDLARASILSALPEPALNFRLPSGHPQ